jgi:hypothetical protein
MEGDQSRMRGPDAPQGPDRIAQGNALANRADHSHPRPERAEQISPI